MIGGVTNYTNWEARLFLQHPALNVGGKRNKLIGRGTFARVYASSKPGRVLKVTTDRMAYAAHVETVAPLRGKYFPKVYRDFGAIGELGGYAVYMVEVERLKACPKAMDKIPAYVTRKLHAWAVLYGGPRSCSVDLHYQNVMQRVGTGDPVVSDPVCDVEQINDNRR